MDTDKLQMEILRKKFDKIYYQVKDDDVYVSPKGHCLYIVPQHRWYLNFETLKSLVDCRECDIKKQYGKYLNTYNEFPEYIATTDIRITKFAPSKKIIKLIAPGGKEMFVDKGYLDMFVKGSSEINFYAANENLLIVSCMEHGINKIAGMITRVRV